MRPFLVHYLPLGLKMLNSTTLCISSEHATLYRHLLQSGQAAVLTGPMQPCCPTMIFGILQAFQFFCTTALPLKTHVADKRRCSRVKTRQKLGQTTQLNSAGNPTPAFPLKGMLKSDSSSDFLGKKYLHDISKA